MIVPKRQLLDDIRTAISKLGSPGAPGLTLASAAADLFEVFIFYIVLDEAINAGARVWLKPSSAGPPPTVAFRTSPGCITATDSYTYALLIFTGVGSPPFKLPLEVHLGAYVAARAKYYETEYDVCVLLEPEVTSCRRNMGGGQGRFNNRLPDSGKAILAVECKYRVQALGASVARNLIGLGKETSAKQIYFVVNTESESVGRRVMSCEGARTHWEPNIYPGSRALSRLRGVLYQTFTDYLFKPGDRR